MNDQQAERLITALEKVLEQNTAALKQNAEFIAYVERRDEEIQDFLMRRDGLAIQRNGAIEQAQKDLKFDIKRAAEAEVQGVISVYKAKKADEILMDINTRKWRQIMETICDRVLAERTQAGAPPKAANE